MVVRDFDPRRVPIVPLEADTPLAIDPYAVLSPRSPECFSRRFDGGVLKSFKERELFNIRNFRKAIC